MEERRGNVQIDVDSNGNNNDDATRTVPTNDDNDDNDIISSLLSTNNSGSMNQFKFDIPNDHHRESVRRIEDAIIEEEQMIQVLEKYLSDLHDDDAAVTASASAAFVRNDSELSSKSVEPHEREEEKEKEEANVVMRDKDNEEEDNDNHNSIRNVFQSILQRMENKTVMNCTNHPINGSTVDQTEDHHHDRRTATQPQQKQQQQQQHNDNWSARLRNFCLTSVQYRNNQSHQSVSLADKHDINNNNEHYILQGYFTINPSVHTEILVVPNHTTVTTATTTKNKHPKSTSTISCSLIYKNTNNTNNSNNSLTKVWDHNPHQWHHQEWCNWLLRQLLPVVQDTCGDNGCMSIRIDDDFDSDHGTSDQQHRTKGIGTRKGKCTTMTSTSPYFLSAYITCIHEYLQFDYQRRVLKQGCNTTAINNFNVSNNAMDCKCCLTKHRFNNNTSLSIQHRQHQRVTVTHLNDYKSTLICIPIDPQQQQASKGRQYKRCAVADDDDYVIDSGPVVQQKSGRVLSIICSWRFNDRKCSLRLHTTTATAASESHNLSMDGGVVTPTSTRMTSIKSLRQPDLDQLVAVCHNDVWQAIVLLRSYCSSCTCWKDYLASTLAIQKQPKNIYHPIPPTTKNSTKRPTRFHRDNTNHTNDDDADDEGGEDFDDDGNGDDDNDDPIFDIHTSKKWTNHVISLERHRKRRCRELHERNNDVIDKRIATTQYNYHLSRKDGTRRRWNFSLQQLNSDNNQQSMDESSTTKEKDSPASPFRLSPSGRHRSDYEVERLVRIERNEKKLSQLGLLLPKDLSHANDPRKTSIVKKRHRSRTKKISVPLSPYRLPMNLNHVSNSRTYPKRRFNNDGSTLPTNPLTLPSRPPPPRGKTQAVRPMQTHQQGILTVEPVAAIPSSHHNIQDDPNLLLPKLPPIAIDNETATTSPKLLQPRRKLPLTHPKRKDHQDTQAAELTTMTLNGYLKSQQNPNWLLPRLPPVPLDTATTLAILYRRPRGVAPKGFTWHPLLGLWVPVDGDDQLSQSKGIATPTNELQTSHQTTAPTVADNVNHSPGSGVIDHDDTGIVFDSESKSVGQPRNFKGSRVTSDRCLVPKKKLMLNNVDGLSYRRPRGKSPAGLKWDALRGVWKPIDVLAPISAVALNFHDGDDNNTGDDFDSRDVDHATVGLVETYHGFLVLPDGCLIPKKELKLDNDGSMYRRPHGASPAGFDWNSSRGIWKPKDVTVAIVTTGSAPNKVAKMKSKYSKKSSTDNGAVTSDDIDIHLERLMRKGFIVRGNGCLLPKKTPKQDPKSPSLYRRPHGASPGRYQWNPIHGVWEPNVKALGKPRYILANDHIDKSIVPNKLREDAVPFQNKEEVLQHVHWKGFRVLKDGCLAAKKQIKPVTKKGDNRRSLWKRPHGAAPAGYDWHSIRGVWVPRNCDTTGVTISNIDTTVLAPILIDVQPPTQYDGNDYDNEIIEVSRKHPVEGTLENQCHYPKRKRLRLLRYTPPID